MSHTSKGIVGTEGQELEGKVIIHCITSSISCFLAPQISRKLMRYGAKVIPVLSPEAAKFIDPLIFEWATGETPITVIEGQVEHVKYAGLSEEKADLILIAPITANSISKIACGIMDTSVTLIAGTALGNNIPIIMVPTMHEVMMNNQAIKENILKLREMNVTFISPRVEEEKAKIPEQEEIVEVCIRKLYNNKLQGKKVLVTAGPTRAYIDGIRFISNPSSGKMGYSIALEAWRRGAEVQLVYGSSSIQPPGIITDTIRIETAKEMFDKVTKAIQENNYDYVILAAAMNDFVAEEIRSEKVSSKDKWEIKLQPAEKLADKIKQLAPNSKLVLFKAEYDKSDEELVKIAKKRMQETNADFIVSNDVSDKRYGFESDLNKVAISSAKKLDEDKWFEGSKLKVAKTILDTI
jgi:phosphopantothenoylcysteine decarboxylase/phosphopantothenate--cysteine ligase